MRHAKTEPAAPRQSDRSRRLTDRGRSDARLIGAKLRSDGYVPDRILCSPAVRTRETLEALLPSLAAAPVTEIVDGLYGAAAADYMAAIAAEGGNARRLMVIGHNPSVHAAAHAAARQGDKAARDRLSETFPTGAFAVIAYAASEWDQALAAPGRLLAFVTPRDIGGGA
jgi:phosphohistidine phosphatase